ncbi:MAG: hypothetical protein HOV80_11125 [Polyangiaceae bacterium]|nr:hypothetical protein [Polyangiaceae bacterium]
MEGRCLRALQLVVPLGVGVLVVDDALAAGAWETVGELKLAREDHTATVLEDGSVLLIAGRRPSPMATAEVFDPISHTSKLLEQLFEARAEHTATLLDDGRVLVTGGSYDQPDDLLDSVEIYDPALGTWSQAAPMSSARAGHAAVRLLDGRVLVTSGRAASGSSVNLTAEVYDPVLDVWSPLVTMNEGREHHQATLLPDGRVLVTGGNRAGDVPIALAEIFDPDTGDFEEIGELGYPRYDHSVAPLPDGRLLIAGGRSNDSNADGLIAAVELYDPSTQGFLSAPSMNAGHSDSQLVVLPDGRVLLVASHSELFDPAAPEQPWKYVGTMQNGRTHFVAALVDGRAFVFGGDARDEESKNIEVWNPRGVSLEPQGFPCSGADECETGFCADGVCCDTACDNGSCDRCAYDPQYSPQNGTCSSMLSCAGYAYVLDEASCSTPEPACKTSCTSPADCNPGYECDLATQRCVVERPGTGVGADRVDPKVADAPDSCTCTMVGQPGKGWLAAAMLPLLVLRRRRRARRRQVS